jgi:shikimate-5-dehydrogenase
MEPTTDTMLHPKHFHIFGHGISFSKSPAIHAAAFEHHGLPHTYDIQETEGIEAVADLISDASFGGASVTMPHKLTVHRFCDDQTESACRIGAINTLVVQPAHTNHDGGTRRRIIGENTDWMGLYQIIMKYMVTSSSDVESGLVIGAGGASRAALYAMHQAGIRKIYLVNRTVANAEKIVHDFRSIFCITVLSSIEEMPESPEIIIGTIPADKTREETFVNLFSRPQGQCIDMAYKPRLTPLLAVAQKHKGWVTVPGVEVLLYQAFDQFKIWTGLDAPQQVMAEAIDASDGEPTVCTQDRLGTSL